MTWLLEMLFDSIRTMCAQFIVDAMDSINGVFTDLLSCNLSLFEELFSVAGELYRNAVLPMGIALLLLICTWQLFKTMFGRIGANAEEPIELVGRSLMCLFMIVFAKPMVDYILNFAGTPYGWIINRGITVASFSEFTSAAEIAASALGIDKISIQLLLLILQFVVAWNYFKLLFVVAERYVLLGVFSYTSPLAFATGGSKATNHILASWSKAFGGQVILIILDAWGLKLYLSAYGNLMASGLGFTKFFVCSLMLVGFCRIMQKLDSYLASFGINVGRTSPGMSGTALAMMAGRMIGRHSMGEGNGSAEHKHTGESQKAVHRYESSADAGGDPIPMGSRKTDNRTEKGMSPENNVESGKYKKVHGYDQDSGVRNSRPEADSGRQENQHKAAKAANRGGDVRRRMSGDGSKTADNAGKSYGQSIPGKRKQERKGRGTAPVSDGGIVSGYDEEAWKSRQEEAACMEAAIDAMEHKDGTERLETDGNDTGIVSSPLPPDEKTLAEPGRCTSELGTGDNDVYAEYENKKSMSEVYASHETGKTAGADRGADAGGSARRMRKQTGSGRPVTGDGEGAADRKKSMAGSSRKIEKDGYHPQRMERFSQDGKLYLSADAYEEPDIPYQIARKNGQRYYAVSQKAASGGVKAKLGEDGSIHYDIVGAGGWMPQRKAGTEAGAEREKGKHGGQDGG